MPKISQLAHDDQFETNDPNFAWQVKDYKEIYLELPPGQRLLLEKLVDELEDEAATVTLAGPPLDLSDLTIDIDQLQSIGAVSPIISEDQALPEPSGVTAGAFPPESLVVPADDEYDPFPRN